MSPVVCTEQDDRLHRSSLTPAMHIQLIWLTKNIFPSENHKNS